MRANEGFIWHARRNPQKPGNPAANCSKPTLAFDSSFNALNQVIYFKRLSEQARRTRGGGPSLQIPV
jgi:hypothetical protein